MNILVFNWRDMKNPKWGGAELNLFEQAEVWVRNGHKVTVLCSAYPGCLGEENISGIDVIRKGGQFTLYIHAMLNYLLHFRGKYDIVVDDINGFPFFTPLFVKGKKVALIHHLVKDIYFRELKFPLSWIGYISERYIMPAVYSNTKIITVSHSSRKEMIESGFREENITVVHNGLNRKYTPSDCTHAAPLIVYVGRIKMYKRLNILVKSMKHIVEAMPDAQLIIIGDGDLRDRLEKLALKLGLERSIIFKGYVSEREKIRYLQQAHVFITTSEKEGWGLSVIEANACGTPAIAFDVPGLNEAIIDGKTGILVKTEDELVTSAVNILKDDSLRAGLSEGALSHAASFSWDKSAEKFLKVLECS